MNPHGLDEAGHVSSARDATVLVRYALGVPFDPRRARRGRRSRSPAAAISDDRRPARELAAARRREDRPHRGRGLVGGGRRSRRGATVYGTVLGGDTREARNAALERLLDSGSPATGASRRSTRAASTQRPRPGTGRPRVELVAPRTLRATVREGGRSSSGSSLPTGRAPGARRASGSAGSRSRTVTGSWLRRTSSPQTSVSEPGALGKARWFAERTAANLWGLVT